MRKKLKAILLSTSVMVGIVFNSCTTENLDSFNEEIMVSKNTSEIARLIGKQLKLQNFQSNFIRTHLVLNKNSFTKIEKMG